MASVDGAVGGAALRLKKTGTGAPVPEYTHFDSQGSAVAATNAAGTITWRERYVPFGQELLNPAANNDNTGYTGHLKDDATGLNYMQARYYDPIIGRFLSTDPIGYQDQLNLYAYVHNDPVNKVDPTGLAAETPWDAFNLAMGAASFGGNVSVGNVPGAVIDALGVIYDGVATGTPGLPGGAGAAITFTRLAKIGNRAFGAARNLAKVGADNKRLVGIANRISNNIRDHLTLTDIGGAVKDKLGMPSGGNHLEEVTNALDGLRGAREDLQGLLKAGTLSSSDAKAASRALRSVSAQISGVEKLLDRADQVCTGTRLCGR